jgi:hypothetical protein
MTIHPFPLYDYLLNKVNTRVEKSIDIKNVCLTINDFSNTLSSEESILHYNNITALMYHHELLTRGMLLTAAPFDGRIMVGGKGILYTISNLPPLLQQIIAQYVDEYSIKEE